MKATRRGFFAGLLACLGLSRAKAAPTDRQGWQVVRSGFKPCEHAPIVVPRRHCMLLLKSRRVGFSQTRQEAWRDYERDFSVRFIRAGSTSPP